MIFTKTTLPGSFIIDLEKKTDDRGFFARTFCREEFTLRNLKYNLVQGNMSYSKQKGTVRGMHYQAAPFEETKLVRCTRGSIYDVIIDLRKDSPTYKKWLGVELSAENCQMLYVPEGFAHGFLTLKDNTEVTYLVTAPYTPSAERGVRWNDPAFGINWPIPVINISEKDKSYPDFINN